MKKSIKWVFNGLLMLALVIVLVQNSHPVLVKLFTFQAEVPLSLLLLGIAILGAAISFITVLVIGSGSTPNQADMPV